LSVVAPEDLRDLAPDMVIVSNAIYLDEIRRQVHDLGLDPDFSVIST
jgi:hypothetical protein